MANKKDGIKITKQQRKAARELAKGKSIKQALMAAGYSEAQASKGTAAIRHSKGLCEAIRQESERWTPEMQKHLIRWRLIDNILSGEDRAVHSAKTLGNSKELNMWKSDVESGVIQIVMPESLARKPEPRQLEAEEVLDMAPPRLLGQTDEEYEEMTKQFAEGTKKAKKE